jgi:plasmid stability protein
MEEEARELIKTGLTSETPRGANLAEAIRRHIAPLGGVELAFPPREPVRRPPDLKK